MNCKTVSKSKSIKYVIDERNSHNKASKNTINLLKRFNSLLKSIFSSDKKASHDYIVNYKSYDSSYNVTDTTELRLIASRRTFL